MKFRNPLFDSPKETATATVIKSKQEVIEAAYTAAGNAEAPIMSPYTGRPMQSAFCEDIPVWVDLENRLALPKMKTGN